ncbi:MAG TPA: PqqD family protein [Dissulfurispiraceae bacterium]|nr:PqqD family protein [Dissulfurispiraceae bacterium]
MSNIKKDVFRKKQEIVSRHIAGETILVPVMGKLAEMQKIFTLNSVGEFIWSRLDGEKGLQEIRDEIVAAFEVEKEQAAAEIEEFISELMKEDLIEAVQ